MGPILIGWSQVSSARRCHTRVGRYVVYPLPVCHAHVFIYACSWLHSRTKVGYTRAYRPGSRIPGQCTHAGDIFLGWYLLLQTCITRDTRHTSTWTYARDISPQKYLSRRDKYTRAHETHEHMNIRGRYQPTDISPRERQIVETRKMVNTRVRHSRVSRHASKQIYATCMSSAEYFIHTRHENTNQGDTREILPTDVSLATRQIYATKLTTINTRVIYSRMYHAQRQIVETHR